MKRFISTKFFLLLQKASQNGIDIDANVLKVEYDRFVMLVFSESGILTDKQIFHNTLVYTRVELASLTAVLKKKRN